MKPNLFRNPKILIPALIILFILAMWGFRNANKEIKPPKTAPVAVASPIATVEINRAFKFPIPGKDSTTEEGNVTFTITTAEKKDEIKVKREPRQTAKGKDYLLLRLEINNPTTGRIKFMSADYVRMIVDDKKFAPDYHNGIVDLDPISVRKDLMAFVVDEKIKSFTMQVGPLDKEKETITVEFK